jgi:hypothetical protein
MHVSEPILEQSVLSLKEVDNDQLMTMTASAIININDSAWHRAHAVILTPPARPTFDIWA